MFPKNVVLGKVFAYVKNQTLGLCALPIQTTASNIFVDLIDKKMYASLQQKTLKNELKLIARDENSNLGLFEIKDPPTKYKSTVKAEKEENINVQIINEIVKN